MRALLVLALFAVPGLACAQGPKSAVNDWLIVPGKRLGPIVASTSRAKLKTLFPAAVLKDETVSEGEDGDKSFVTRITGGGLDATVVWPDRKRSRIGRIMITSKDARWRTEEGIRVGLPLRELEKLNGKPISFNGFGGELGGGIDSWHGGTLQKYGEGAGLYIVLGPTGDMDDATAKFYGEEAKARSDDPLAAKLKIEVESLSVGLR
ncbi:MAG: hypothetical protein ACT4P3_13635 [Betaproteobacteria bacterium]